MHNMELFSMSCLLSQIKINVPRATFVNQRKHITTNEAMASVNSQGTVIIVISLVDGVEEAAVLTTRH